MPTITSRRNVLIGLAALFAAPAIVRIGSLMPVRVLALPADEPMLTGVRFQNWPIGSPRPYFHTYGSISSVDGTRKPLSHWLKAIDRYSDRMFWEPLPDWRIAADKIEAVRK